MDDDERIALVVSVSGEPGGDGVTCALVVRLVGKVVLICEIVIEENHHVLARREPFDGLVHITRYIQNV
jgi:hypothetical protein